MTTEISILKTSISTSTKLYTPGTTTLEIISKNFYGALTSLDTTTSISEKMTFAEISSSARPTNLTIITPTPQNAIVQVSDTAQTIIAIYMGFLTFFGIANNSVVLFLYHRYKNLHNPVNMFLMNICLGDLIVSTLGTPFMSASTVAGYWLFGDGGCTWYAFIVTIAGCEQIVALAAVSVQRCLLVVRPFTAKKMTNTMAFLFLSGTWTYSLIITLPPAFGWNAYVVEGAGTACGVDWASGDPTDQSYIIFMFTTILGIPLTIIVGSYGLLLYAVKKMGETDAGRSSTTRADRKVTIMIVVMISAFLIAWTPYAAFALYVTAGNADKISPIMGTAPSLFAKLCTVYNPIIYFLLNKQFKDAFIDWAFCGRNPFEREESDDTPGNQSQTQQRGVTTVSGSVSRQKRKRGRMERTQSCATEISDIGPSIVPNARQVFVASTNPSDTVEEMQEIQATSGDGSGQDVTEVTSFKNPPAEATLTGDATKDANTNLKPPTAKKIMNRATVTPLPGQPTDEDGPKVDV